MIKRILYSFPYSATSMLLAIADCTLEFLKTTKMDFDIDSIQFVYANTVELNVPFIEKMIGYVLLLSIITFE